VLVARRLPPAGTELLAGRCTIREGGLDVTREELFELAPGVDAIVADPPVAVDEALLEAAGPQLRVVANFAVGYDNVDLDACRAREVAVTNTPDVLTNATAELALALTLAAARRMSEAEADLRGGRWRGWDPGAYLGLELTGATFGVIGLGRIGRRYAELVAGFAGEVLYVSRTRKEDAERELGVRRVALEEVFSRADVVSLHLPASTETAGLVGSRELAQMKPQAILVNTSRGPRRVRARARGARRTPPRASVRAVASHRLRHEAGPRRHGSLGGRKRPRRAWRRRAPEPGCVDGARDVVRERHTDLPPAVRGARLRGARGHPRRAPCRLRAGQPRWGHRVARVHGPPDRMDRGRGGPRTPRLPGPRRGPAPAGAIRGRPGKASASSPWTTPARATSWS